jgi:hypothetical protein
MVIISKPQKVNPREIIKSSTINTIIQGLQDVEDYINSKLQLLQDHIEYGKVSGIPTSSNDTLTYNVQFNKPFTSSPYVFISIENLDPNVDVNVFVSNVSTTGFTLNVKVIRLRTNTYCNVNWLAIL